MSILQASPTQERIWFLEQLDAGRPSGQTLSVCVRFDGRVILDRLSLALRAVIGRHGILRSVYRRESDRLVADVLPVGAIDIPETGSRITPTLDEHAVASVAREVAEAPFNMARGPLIRALIVANGPEQCYLVLVAHRVVCDDWSLRVLLSELADTYTQGGEPRAPVRSREDAERTTVRAGGPPAERDAEYWRQRLERLEDLPPLASDVPASDGVPAVHRVNKTLGRDLGDRVDAYARDRDLTPASVLAASLQLLMYRLGFGGHSVLGMPLTRRTARRRDDEIGCFLDMVVLCGSVRRGDSFDDLALRVRDNTEEALEHGAHPFEVMVPALARKRDRLRKPLYQALLVTEDPPQPAPTIPGVRATYVAVPRFRGSIDTMFTVRLRHAEPAIGLEWNGALKLPANRLIDCWLHLLRNGLRQADIGVDDLSLTADSTARRADGHRRGAQPTVPELVCARAEREPRAAAVICDGLETSLGELVQQSVLVAERLRAAGVRPGTAVGLSATRSKQTIVATLAILAAGGVCVPLDPEYPTERLRFILDDSGSAMVLTEDPRDGTWMGAPARMLDGTGTARVALGSGSRSLDGSVAWVLYTSGSTGRPKGVLISHEMVTARLLREPIPWEADDRCCHKTPLNFIDSIWEMFGPPVHGLPTVVANHDTARDPRALARLVQQEGVTRIVLVPSFLSALLDLESLDLARLSGVKYWISSGEALPSSVAERFYRALPGATLVNLYGASECWDVTWCKVPASVRAGDAVPIGEPLEDVSVWLLDDGLNPVPDEVPAELFVSGPCVSNGYLERPQLAAGRFLPAAMLEGSRMGMVFRTGDIARRRSDGSLEILGRRDLQVKVRGFRIEVEEIERQLLSIADVTEAAVVPREDDEGSVIALTAFVVLAAGATLNVAAYRRLLAEQLPMQCVPNDYVQLDSMPLTANGKLDRAGLGARVKASSPRERAKRFEADRNVEQRLMRIWCDVLDLEHVDARDDFFHLGGHSLLAMQVLLRIQDEFAAELSLRDFYADPTVSRLSKLLTS